MRSFLIASSCILLVAIAGCGSDAGSTSTPPPSGNTPPPVTPPAAAPIEGVATPSSVAVVTGTNAQ
jgi:hypothetical protein